MSDKTLYRLGDHTSVEPLVNRFAAWANIVSPLSFSLYLQHYQLEVLRSYLKDPEVHFSACKNPKLRSGPLVDISVERADEVATFLATTEIDLDENLKFARSLFEFHNYLVAEAKGLTMEPFYYRLPPELRGYVELVYDYYHRPHMRFFEGLLYDSPYYRRDLQSFRLFLQQRGDGRPFFMSTPRLSADDEIEWNIPFDSPLVDELFKLEHTPQPLGYIRELLGLTADDDARLLPLLTTGDIASHRYDGPLRVRYYGHACVLIEWKGVSILTDPCLGVTPISGGIERFTYQDLPERIDYILITHGHHDHFCLESLLRLRNRTGCIVVPHASGVFYGDVSLKIMCERLGFKVVELDALESIPLPGGEIIGIPFLGEHVDLPHNKSAYVVRSGDEQMLFAADSDCLDPYLYENVRRAIGPIQSVFVGMECVGAPLSWSCGPFLPVRPEHSIEQSRRSKGCDSERAQLLLRAVEAQRLYVYAMGREPWLEYLLGLALTEQSKQVTEARRLVRVAEQQGFAESRLLFGRDEIYFTPLAPIAPVDFANQDHLIVEDQFSFS